MFAQRYSAHLSTIETVQSKDDGTLNPFRVPHFVNFFPRCRALLNSPPVFLPVESKEHTSLAFIVFAAATLGKPAASSRINECLRRQGLWQGICSNSLYKKMIARERALATEIRKQFHLRGGDRSMHLPRN